MKPDVIREPEQARRRSRAARAEGRSVALVPTMGYLHAGHMSLLSRAREECGFVMASIFVNPAQFGPQEDFDRYPRDPDRDLAMLAEARADAVFCPETAALYPADGPGYRTWVTVEGLGEVLCGDPSRRGPGHFRGVTTVVAKLLNIVEPDVAYFGQKDAQQAVVISTMARDLNMAPRIEICPTVREPDGLAMSSRNKFLSPAERAAAPVIHRALAAAETACRAGERSPRALVERARIVLAGEPMFKPEYVELVAMSDLKPFAGDAVTAPALLAVAGRIGNTRLIDNVVLADKGRKAERR